MTESSSDAEIKDDTITLSVGAEYQVQTSAAVRTIIINPDPDQRANYKLLEKAFYALVDSITPGSKISSAYHACKAVFEEEKKEDKWLSAHLPKSFGFGIGLKHKDSLFEITPTNERVIEAGNSFHLSLYLKDLKKGSQTYALYLADTVIAQAKPAVVTDGITKDYKDISYTLDDSDDEEEEKGEAYINTKNVVVEKRTRGRGMQIDEQ